MNNQPSWLARVGASIIDGLVLGLPIGAIFTVMSMWLVPEPPGSNLNPVVGAPSDPTSFDPTPATAVPFPTHGLEALGIVWLVVMAANVFYYVFFNAHGRQTVGKRVTGYRVVDTSGDDIGYGRSFARFLGQIINGLPCYLGYLWPLWDSEKRTFADMICGTRVVRADATLATPTDFASQIASPTPAAGYGGVQPAQPETFLVPPPTAHPQQVDAAAAAPVVEAPAPAQPETYPAGWYPTSDGQHLRWFDGTGWTEHVRPAN